MADFFDPVMDLSKKHYTAIGEFIFRFAQIEYQLHEIIWAVFDLEYKKGRILTIGADVTALCAMLSTITSADSWVKKRVLIQEINFIVRRVRKHRKFRNQLVHGSWQAIGGKPRKAVLHFMNEQYQRLLPRYDPKLDAASISKKAEQISRLNRRAEKLIRQLNAERPSSQGKSL